MKQGFMQEHWTDGDGNPAGGVSSGTGFTISWQNGPLRAIIPTPHANLYHLAGSGATATPMEPLILSREPNGAFVEDVIEACVDRIEFYQRSRFACKENEDALYFLRQALFTLDMRTKNREERGVEGTHNE
jgi:hypothetical protein